MMHDISIPHIITYTIMKIGVLIFVIFVLMAISILPLA